ILLGCAQLTSWKKKFGRQYQVFSINGIMKTTVRLLLVFALFSSCARVLVRLEPIFREVQGFRSRYFEDYDYDNGDYQDDSIYKNPGRGIVPMVANKGTTATAEPITNPRETTTEEVYDYSTTTDDGREEGTVAPVNPGRGIVPMVANKGTTATAEPITNPRETTTEDVFDLSTTTDGGGGGGTGTVETTTEDVFDLSTTTDGGGGGGTGTVETTTEDVFDLSTTTDGGGGGGTGTVETTTEDVFDLSTTTDGGGGGGTGTVETTTEDVFDLSTTTDGGGGGGTGNC
uniref:Lpxtg-motif cell wall anchor domain protein n=1 Tax=Haemonchus contortus TaxID=6289 RepID=A0A7I4YBZ0_HAECO